MGRAISNKNVVNAKFETADFDGEFLASFGRPELRGTWIIYGGSGSGKTTFVMQLSKYLTRFGRVEMEEVGTRIILLAKESLQDLKQRLSKKQSPDIVVIDSVQYWHGLKWSDVTGLKDEYPNKLFIFVSHERGSLPDGKLAQKIRYDSDIKIRTEGYKAFVTTRYEVPELGEGGKDFVIWEEGASRYWCDI